jgi:hypothetical protein
MEDIVATPIEEDIDTTNFEHVDFQIIQNLLFKYRKNAYMLQRLNTHLLNLPHVLEQECKKYEERLARYNELTTEQENFYKVFLNKYQYFYMPHNNSYYEYDGKTYHIIKDDHIHHRLLSSITFEKKLIQWKHKTKVNIIKKIKERNLFKSIPETYTIQNVLSFLQSLFASKIESKYFLTVIGDCILKKNTDNLLYFVSLNLKKIIRIIDVICGNITGHSILAHFITKYHDCHKLTSYRLIKTTDTVNVSIIKSTLNNIGIDLLCVATHYSDRYGNASNYLITKADDDFKQYVLYFTQKSLQMIVSDFIYHCIEETSDGPSGISWKNMHYIWKLYLSNICIPNVVYSLTLLDIFMTMFSYTNSSGNIIFHRITSKHLPEVRSFLNFWERHIQFVNESILNVSDEYEYEIDELISLYKQYDKKNGQITDTNMIKMIRHYFSPQVKVVDNKYIMNIQCNLWSKTDDIINFLQTYKTHKLNSDARDNPSEIISVDELYNSYQTFFNTQSVMCQKQHLIVSKQFFERFILKYLANYIKFDKFVSSEWFYDIR